MLATNVARHERRIADNERHPNRKCARAHPERASIGMRDLRIVAPATMPYPGPNLAVILRRPPTEGLARYFASGSGRSWKWKTLLVVPLPVSMWNGARVLIVAHTPRPFQPAFASSMRPSIHFV